MNPSQTRILSGYHHSSVKRLVSCVDQFARLFFFENVRQHLIRDSLLQLIEMRKMEDQTQIQMWMYKRIQAIKSIHIYILRLGNTLEHKHQ